MCRLNANAGKIGRCQQGNTKTQNAQPAWKIRKSLEQKQETHGKSAKRGHTETSKQRTKTYVIQLQEQDQEQLRAHIRNHSCAEQDFTIVMLVFFLGVPNVFLIIWLVPDLSFMLLTFHVFPTFEIFMFSYQFLKQNLLPTCFLFFLNLDNFGQHEEAWKVIRQKCTRIWTQKFATRNNLAEIKQTAG